jgi:hypothetical protein
MKSEAADARERRRIERALARSEAELGASLRVLETRVRTTLSPRRVARAHLGWMLLGALVVGVGLGWRREEGR